MPRMKELAQRGRQFNARSEGGRFLWHGYTSPVKAAEEALTFFAMSFFWAFIYGNPHVFLPLQAISSLVGRPALAR